MHQKMSVCSSNRPFMDAIRYCSLRRPGYERSVQDVIGINKERAVAFEAQSRLNGEFNVFP